MNYQENQQQKEALQRDKRVQHRMRGDCKKHKPKNKRQEILQNPGKLKQKSTGTGLSVH